MNALGPPPSQTPLMDDNGITSPAWVDYFSTLYFMVTFMSQSGITAQRPVKNIYVGRQYFDTTIMRPIWYNGTAWQRADGVIV